MNLIPFSAMQGRVISKIFLISLGVHRQRVLPYTLPHMSFTVRKIKEEKPPHPLVVALIKGAQLSLRLWVPMGQWYKHWKARKQASDTEKKRLGILKKVLTVLVCILLFCLVIAGVVKAMVSAKVLTLSTAFSVVGTDLPTDANGFTNILLLGKGDDEHEGTDLTDSMMLLSLDPRDTKSAFLMSVPRDLYILDNKHGIRGRVNQLYRDYRITLRNKGTPMKDTPVPAMNMLAEEMGYQFGIDIHHVFMVNFSAFTKIVDEIGGIDVTVPEDLVDTEYPNETEDGYTTFMLKAGPQHLDGTVALKYVRSRHSTSDFGRSARQQQVLGALKEKAETEGILRSPGKLISLWNIVSQNTLTTMTLGEMLGLAELGTKIDRGNLITLQLNNQTGYEGLNPLPGGMLYNPPRDQFDGASVLLPISIPEFPVTYRHIKLLVQLLTQNRPLYLAPPSIAVFNASGKSGLAYLLASEFTRFNIRVDETGNYPGGKRDTSVIIARSEADRGIAQFFGDILDIPVEVLDPETPTEGLALVQIVLGKDFTYQPFVRLFPEPAVPEVTSESSSSSDSSISSDSSDSSLQ